jgi:hypothetical protein
MDDEDYTDPSGSAEIDDSQSVLKDDKVHFMTVKLDASVV